MIHQGSSILADARGPQCETFASIVSKGLPASLVDAMQQQRRARAARGARRNVRADRGDMPLYRRLTTRHVDFYETSPAALPCFYICDYGPLCDPEVACGQSVEEGTSFEMHFDDEMGSERVDVTLAPDVLVDKRECTALSEYVCRTLRFAENTSVQRAFQRPRSSTAAVASRARRRAEWVYRVALLASLRGAPAAPPAVYATYAALSPFHERTFEELHALVHARSAEFVPHDHVATALAWLAERGLVRLLPMMALRLGSTYVERCDYDYGLTQRARALFENIFARAPGMQVSGGTDFMAVQRDNLRRTVVTYRQMRLVEQLKHQRPVESTVPRAPTQPRPLTEYSVLVDVLHVHGIGLAEDAMHADTEKCPLTPWRAPSHVFNMILAASCLENPMTPAVLRTPRTRSNSTSSTASTNSGASTPRSTNPWESQFSVDWERDMDDDNEDCTSAAHVLEAVSALVEENDSENE